MRWERHLPELLERVYDTVLHPEAWVGLLERLSDLTGGGGSANLLHQDLREPRGDINEVVRLEPAAIAAYNDYYGTINPWFSHGAAHVEAGRVVVSDRHALPVEELVKTEFYNDYLRPNDIAHSCNAVLFCDEMRVGSLVVQRSARSGPFSDAEIDLLQALLPHLQRALQLRRRLADVAAERDALAERLDRTGQAVVLLDGAHRIAYSTRCAEAILSAGESLRRRPDSTLTAARTDEAAALQRLIAGASRTARGNADGAGGVLRVSRPHPRVPLSLLVAPLPGLGEPFGPPRAQVAVFIADPEADMEEPEAALRRVYGLTRAEAQLARLLAQGTDLRRAADELAISVHTARTHLKRVFAKTDCGRQSELVSLLFRTRLTA